MRLRFKRWQLFILAGLILTPVVLGAGYIYHVGSELSAPAPHSIGPPPADLHARDVLIPSHSGSTIHGWLIENDDPRGAIILMHGARSNRLSMVERARFLCAAHYDVLLFDFQAHGESPGAAITFGHLESFDAQAAFDWMKQRFPALKLAVLGDSMGGAACLLGPHPLRADAMILECVYPDIRTAVTNRVNLFWRPGAGPWLAPLLLAQLKYRLDSPPSQMRPIDAIRNIECPLLLVAGAHDLRTTIAESRRLYAAAPEPKEMWEVKDAGHTDYYHYVGKPYEERVLGFLDKSMPPAKDGTAVKSIN